MIALAYYSPPTRQQIDAAESAHRESAAGLLVSRFRSAASSISAPGCTPTRAVEQRHGADGAAAHAPSAPTIERCNAWRFGYLSQWCKYVVDALDDGDIDEARAMLAAALQEVSR